MSESKSHPPSSTPPTVGQTSSYQVNDGSGTISKVIGPDPANPGMFLVDITLHNRTYNPANGETYGSPQGPSL